MWKFQERKIKSDLVGQQGRWKCPSLRRKNIFFQGKMTVEADRYVYWKHTEFVCPSYVQETFRYSDLDKQESDVVGDMQLVVISKQQ